jgi:endonuclease/exonuclease/phosphatase family metal-dependent hydrolase
VVAPASGSSTTQPHTTLAGAAKRAAVDINVASFNIQSAGHDRTAGACATVVRQILSNRTDVVGIQEAVYTPSFVRRLANGRTQYLDLRNGLNGQGGRYAVTVNAAVNCLRPYVAHNCRPRDRNASAAERILFNKRTLALVRTGALRYTRQTARTPNMSLAWAVLRSKSTGARFLFTTTHLDPSSRAVRKSQWRQMIRTVRRVRNGLPVVSVGDFNTNKIDPMARTMLPAMRQAGFGDVLNQQYRVNPSRNVRARSRVNGWLNTYNHLSRRVATFGYEDRRGNTGNGIDLIFASNHLAVMEYEVVCDFNPRTLRVQGTLPSDHNMIRAKIRLP